MNIILKNICCHLFLPLLITLIMYYDGVKATVGTPWGDLSPFTSLMAWYIIVSFTVRGFWRLVDELIPTYD